MSVNYTELALFFVVILLFSPLIGRFIARVFCDEDEIKIPVLSGLYNICLRGIGKASKFEMNWKQYAVAILFFNGIGFVVLVTILSFQNFLPLNPQKFPTVPFWLAVNTAVSFVTNTNWQAYSGESTLSYFAQMTGLTTQNFVSAATGIGVMVALARGIKREKTDRLGNFWRDLTKSTVYILLPLSVILAIILMSQGVIQNFASYVEAETLSKAKQLLPMGPAASQIAIKQLGTNGGGFFGVNSAHPFENPTPISNFLELIAILLIPAALPFAFGKLCGSLRHGRALFGAMFILFFVSFIAAFWSEIQLNHAIADLPFLEGKELRFGIGTSVLWGTATTVASNGSVNSMISSFSPIAGGLSLINILLGEVVFGGVGSGVYGIVLFVILTVFMAGLMVGRTPEYLGKKIEAQEIRYAAVGVILPSILILIFSALTVSTKVGLSSLLSMGPHGLSEVLYAFSSGSGNNGSAFAGLNANTPYYNSTMAICMILGRYGVILPVLYIAGRLSLKKRAPTSLGTFPTEGPLFIALLCAVILIVGALTFFPALSLGPIMEELLMLQGRIL